MSEEDITYTSDPISISFVHFICLILDLDTRKPVIRCCMETPQKWQPSFQSKLAERKNATVGEVVFSEGFRTGSTPLW